MDNNDVLVGYRPVTTLTCECGKSLEVPIAPPCHAKCDRCERVYFVSLVAQKVRDPNRPAITAYKFAERKQAVADYAVLRSEAEGAPA